LEAVTEPRQREITVTVAVERNRNMDKYALVDVSHIFRAKWHAGGDMEINHAFEQTIRRVYDIDGSGDYRAIACCFDVAPYERCAFYPAYKANRETSSIDMVDQYRRLAKKLKERFHVFGVEGWEADDVIATIRAKLPSDCSVDIWTNDKDLFQLIDERTFVVSTATGERFGIEEAFSKFGMPPERLLELFCIIGDKSDNVPGVPGFGIKRAVQVLLRANSMKEALRMSQEELGLTDKLWADWRQHKDTIATAQALIQLRTDLKVDVSEMLLGKKESPRMTQYDDTPDPEYIPESIPDAPAPAKKITAAEIDQALARLQDVQPAIMPSNVPAQPPQYDEGPASVELRPGVYMTPGMFKLLGKMAETFAKTNFYKMNAPSIFTIMTMGIELGIAPQSALLSIHIISSKPCLASHMVIALAKRDKTCEYMECEEETATQVTYVCKKRGFPKELRFTYSLDDAKADGLSWANVPKNRRAMLRKTAGCQAARLWFPEAILGLYSPAEMGMEETDEAA
jgi:5'-3' exonuclease